MVLEHWCYLMIVHAMTMVLKLGTMLKIMMIMIFDDLAPLIPNAVDHQASEDGEGLEHLQ